MWSRFLVPNWKSIFALKLRLLQQTKVWPSHLCSNDWISQCLQQKNECIDGLRLCWALKRTILPTRLIAFLHMTHHSHNKIQLPRLLDDPHECQKIIGFKFNPYFALQALGLLLRDFGCWAMLGKVNQFPIVSMARIVTLWPARTCANPTPPAHSGQLPRKLPGARTVPWLAKSVQYSTIYMTYIGDLRCFYTNFMIYNISQLIINIATGRNLEYRQSFQNEIPRPQNIAKMARPYIILEYRRKN